MDMNKLKEDMLKQCQLEYKNNQVQSNYIEDFSKSCTPDNVLNWYTKHSCIYLPLNKAFRTRNIDLICKFRYFIILLYNRLKDLSLQQQGESYTTVYRGQIMKENELKNLQSNIGRLISINSFMSTTRHENVARMFLCENGISVLFEINTANASYNVLHPFADISQISTIKDEEETLFFPSAIFRIDSVELENSSTWIIKLSLSNQTVEQIKQIMNGFEKQLTFATHCHDLSMKTDDYNLFNKYHRLLTNKRFTSNDILSFMEHINFDYLINNSGNYEKAIEYYKQLLSNEKFIDNSKSIVLHIIIGNNYFHLKQFDDALIHYDIALSLLDDNNRLAGEIHNHIGDVWREKNDFESALSYYKEALNIFDGHHVQDHNVAEICRKISDIYFKQNKYEYATLYEEQANEFDKRYGQTSWLDYETLSKHYQNQLNIKFDRPVLEHACIQYSNGLHLIKKGDYSQALKSLLQAKQLFTDHLPLYNYVAHKFAKLLENIAFAYLCLKDHFNALITWKKAIDIRTSFRLN